jgi:hypothetical protein
MEIIIILIVILVVFYFCYLNSINNKLTKTESFDAPSYNVPTIPPSYNFPTIPPSYNLPTIPPLEPHITMYEHTNYRGRRFYCRIGFTNYSLLNKLSFNDKANSIIIPQGLRAVFYEHADRGGRKLSLDAGDYPNLVNFGWNDMISSVDVFTIYKKIEEEGAKIEAFDAPNPPPQKPTDVGGGTILNDDYVTMYEDWYFQGNSFKCPIGHTSYETLNNAGWNDKASSIKVPAGLRAVFYEHSNRGGHSFTLGAGNYDRLVHNSLDPSVGVGAGWNDRISSVDVFKV